MSSSNLQQWWESTYRHHQAKTTIYDANVLLQQPQPPQQQQQQQHYSPPLAPFNFSITRTTTIATTTTTTAIPTTSIIETAVSAIGHLSSDYESTGRTSSAFENYYFINSNIFTNSSITNQNDNNNNINIMSNDDNNEYDIPSLTVLFMAISYGLVVFGGILGNATLVLTLCSASSVRLRNPLLLAVCIADLLVTGISAPFTLLNLAMNRTSRSLPLALCKVMHFIQIMPVAASTISFFLLSLDRYATVKHPRLAQLRQRRYLHVSLALISWIVSAAICAPFLFAYKTTVIMVNNSHNNNHFNIASTNANFSVINNNQLITNNNNMNKNNSISIVSCSSAVGDNNSLFVYFVFFHTFAVFVLPGFGVLLNHYGVRQKLCALSLTARAAHGELPLPMPILRRQTHMVIVTGIAKVQKAAAGCATQTEDDSSNEENCGIQLQNMNPMAEQEENSLNDAENVEQDDIVCELDIPATIQVQKGQTIKTTNPISPRAMREIRAYSQRQRINGNTRRQMTAGIPLPQTSTLHSRRRLANMLIASAMIFIACWSPHVFCIFYTNFGNKNYCNTTSTYFNLLLGYMYSAISPVIYWILNHNTLRQSPCAPIIGMRSMQNFLRTRFRSHAVPPPAPSSTNEAALGPFNPKFIKLTPKQYRAHASSHYLY